MVRRSRARLIVLASVAGLTSALSAQSWSPPRTSWGDPDLQGVWSTATITPLERPAELAGKAFFTVEEAAAYERDTLARTNRDRRDGGAAADVARAYNDFWWDSGTQVVPTLRTSLIVDPPDGRIPVLTPAAQQRQAAQAEARARRGPADHPEDRNLWERCITRGVPTVMLTQPYNNHYQILQTPDHVVILAEMIHDARIIPLTRHEPAPASMRFWMGDSVGRWDGDTLVIETTNFNGHYSYRGASEQVRLIERLRRTADEVLLYQVTVHDPAVFTRDWTIELPARRSADPIYEYACHEANYGLEGILRGHRAQEKAATTSAKPR